jgi:hypothetical protein
MSARKARPAQSGRAAAPAAEIGRFRARHLDLAQRPADPDRGGAAVTVDEAESPLAWLARRKGRDGRPLIEPLQFAAGERLRAEFTQAQMMPRVTANWNATVADGPRGAGATTFSDAAVAARQRVHRALDAAGPEFAGLLIDVCCFLKPLSGIELERGWPARSAKVVLQLGLDRLVRHYRLAAAAHGPSRTPLRSWLGDGAAFVVERYGGE